MDALHPLYAAVTLNESETEINEICLDSWNALDDGRRRMYEFQAAHRRNMQVQKAYRARLSQADEDNSKITEELPKIVVNQITLAQPPSRPPSAYRLYCKATSPSVTAANPTLEKEELTMRIHESWALSDKHEWEKKHERLLEAWKDANVAFKNAGDARETYESISLISELVEDEMPGDEDQVVGC
jgi:hypothetical protein